MLQGGEYNNHNFHSFFATHWIQMCFSCPHTSQQNRKYECMLRTINNVVRTLLLHAHTPPTYWVESLHMTTHLLNILPLPLSTMILHFTNSLNNHLPIIIYMCLVFFTLPIFFLLTNSPLVSPHVFSWDILPTTKDIIVSVFINRKS